MLCDQRLCTGCGACSNVCDNNAIKMVYDQYGFFKAEYHAETCTHCNRCLKVCPVINRVDLNRKLMKVYAAWSKNNNICKSSNSGGMFFSFASEIIKNGGVVFGAKYAEDFSVYHTYVEDIVELKSLMLSKFAQSNTGSCFRLVKTFLEQNRLVLFVGSPCQISGLYSYLGRDEKNLITAQFPCFGIPSQKFFKDYVLHITKMLVTDIKSIGCEVQIDSKLNERYMVYISKGNKVITEPASKSFFVNVWNSGWCQSEVCFHCKFNIFPVQADIIWGNFWHLGEIEKFSVPKAEYSTGVSMLILNSTKAIEFYNRISDKIFAYSRKPKEAISSHWMFQTSFDEHLVMRRYYNSAKRKSFQNDLVSMDFHDLVEKYSAIIEGKRNNTLLLISKLFGKKVTALIWRLLYYYYTLKIWLKNT